MLKTYVFSLITGTNLLHQLLYNEKRMNAYDPIYLHLLNESNPDFASEEYVYNVLR